MANTKQTIAHRREVRALETRRDRLKISQENARVELKKIAAELKAKRQKRRA